MLKVALISQRSQRLGHVVGGLADGDARGRVDVLRSVVAQDRLRLLDLLSPIVEADISDDGRPDIGSLGRHLKLRRDTALDHQGDLVLVLGVLPSAHPRRPSPTCLVKERSDKPDVVEHLALVAAGKVAVEHGGGPGRAARIGRCSARQRLTLKTSRVAHFIAAKEVSWEGGSGVHVSCMSPKLRSARASFSVALRSPHLSDLTVCQFGLRHRHC